MPPRPNQNVGKALVLFVGAISVAGLGIGAVYLPFYSEDGKKRAAAVAKGQDANAAVLGGRGQEKGGGSRGSMWKNMKDQG
jgi:hypothetical protein